MLLSSFCNGVLTQSAQHSSYGAAGSADDESPYYLPHIHGKAFPYEIGGGKQYGKIHGA